MPAGGRPCVDQPRRRTMGSGRWHRAAWPGRRPAATLLRPAAGSTAPSRRTWPARVPARLRGGPTRRSWATPAVPVPTARARRAQTAVPSRRARASAAKIGRVAQARNEGPTRNQAVGLRGPGRPGAVSDRWRWDDSATTGASRTWNPGRVTRRRPRAVDEGEASPVDPVGGADRGPRVARNDPVPPMVPDHSRPPQRVGHAREDDHHADRHQPGDVGLGAGSEIGHGGQSLSVSTGRTRPVPENRTVGPPAPGSHRRAGRRQPLTGRCRGPSSRRTAPRLGSHSDPATCTAPRRRAR